MTNKNRPQFIGNYQDFIEEDNAHYPNSDELMSIGSPVGRKLGLKKIGIHIEKLPQGRRTSWPHAESEEEEFAFVLKGSPHVWINGYTHQLKEGDFVAFPSGTGIAHTFINNTESEVLLLVGGEATKSENKIYYPLHPERNEEMKAKGIFWENSPKQEMGSHDGKSDEMKYQSLPVFYTDRLVLRPLTLNDVPAYQKNFSDYEVIRYLSSQVPWPYPDNGAEFFIQNMVLPRQGKDRWCWGIFEKANPQELIGCVDLWRTPIPENRGFWLGKKFWGKGFMTEAVTPITDYAFSTLGFEELYFTNALGNERSRRVKEKTGAKFIEVKEAKFVDSSFTQTELWKLDKKSWQNLK